MQHAAGAGRARSRARGGAPSSTRRCPRARRRRPPARRARRRGGGCARPTRPYVVRWIPVGVAETIGLSREQPLRTLEGMDERERVGLHLALHGSPSLGPASLYSLTRDCHPDTRDPTLDDVQPVANEALDRFLTGLITALPIIGLFVVAWQVWADLLFWSDLIVFAIIYAAHRASASPSASTACSPTAPSRPTKGVRATLAILGSAAIEGPVISWVADHRKHHAFSDAPGDPHSPHVDHGHGLKGALRGLLHAHVGWLFIHTERGSHERYAPDLLADPTIRWVNKWFFAWAIGGLRRGVRARLADRRLPSHRSHRTVVGWGRAHAGPAPRDLLDQLAVPLLRAPPVRDEGRVAEPAVAGDPVLRRVVAQQPPRLPDLGRARHAPLADRHLGDGDPRCSRSWASPGTSCASAPNVRRSARCLEHRRRCARRSRAPFPSGRSASSCGTARPLASTDGGPTFSLRTPQALGHVLRSPGQLGVGRAYVSGALEVDDVEAALALLDTWSPPPIELARPRADRRRGRARRARCARSRTCPTPSCARAAAATASRATAARSATTTTSPTSSSSCSSASR